MSRRKNPKAVVQQILKAEGKDYKEWIEEKHNEFIQESVLSGKLLFTTEEAIEEKAEEIAEEIAEKKIQEITDNKGFEEEKDLKY
ncbi:MAG TPA: hypothetical protein VK071_04210 [Tissierellales bacterium]|nr:hypothetical protein [Tissierellales bacterium]